MKKYYTLITLLILSNFVNAAPLRFDFVFDQNPGTARTTGFIVFESTLLANPGGGIYSLPNPLILDLQVTVTGTAGSNGVFTLNDFTDIIFNTGGIALDFSRDLVGQNTDSLPWGTPGQADEKSTGLKARSNPDFSLIANQQQPAKINIINIDNNTPDLRGLNPAPSSIAPFVLEAPSGESMAIVSFVVFSANPIPSLNDYSLILFGLLLFMIGFFTLRKRT